MSKTYLIHYTSLQGGNPVKKREPTKKYKRIMQNRERLQKSFARGELSERKFLVDMGALSLKAEVRRVGWDQCDEANGGKVVEDGGSGSDSCR